MRSKINIGFLALALADLLASPALAQPGHGPISGGGGGSSSGAATSVQGSATLPATCAELDLYQDTDSTGSEFYVCTATDTWTKTGTIGGSTGATDDVAICADGAGGSTVGACTQALFPLGTAGAPGISFTGDPNTGIYSTADALEFSTAGSSRLGVDATGVYVRATVASGLGAAKLQSFVWNLNARTQGVGSPLVHSYTQTLGIDTNEGSTAKNYITLPAASTALQLSFIVQDADGQRVTAAAGDTIRIIDKVTAAGGYVESTTIGSTLVLVAVNATEWIATSVTGTYTDGTFTYDDTGLTTP